MPLGDVYFADDFKPSFGIPWVGIPDREILASWPQEQLVEYLAFREERNRQALDNPVGAGWTLPMWHEVMENFCKYQNIIILGGNRCLAPEVPLWVEERQQWVPISEIGCAFTTDAWDGSKQVLAKASAPFIKGRQQMLKVRLSGSGKTFRCTPAHRLLCSDGEFRQVRHIGRNHKVASLSDTIGFDIIATEWDLEADVWDVSVDVHENYITAGIVHHNSSKSVIASRLCVWAAGTIPAAEVRAYHVNEDRSIEDQQRMIYDALPIGIRSLPTKKGLNHSVQYSQKNGFTDNICILPPLTNARRGGSIKFSNYRSYQADAQVAEGYKAHLIWCDEECPQKMFETLQYRTSDYHGRIILTFTTLTGWTPLVQDILGKTKTIKKRFAPLVGKELPIIQESLSRPNTVIFYFWTEDNAFLDTSDFSKKLLGRPREEVLARAYGIPTKSITSVFPGFNKEVNVIPHETIPFIRDSDYAVTRYMAVDPAGSKNWFILWVAIDAAGTWWVYREWPDYDDWALPGSSAEGKPGPAQKGSKKGIRDYVELIEQCENGETIYERYIDPRLGAAERQSAEGATTIISELDDVGMTFIPAPGVEIENGLQLINGLLSYDEKKPISAMNGPKLYISDRCQNLVYSMQEYTARGGKDEATKDPVDCLRYLLVSNCEFIDGSKVEVEDNRTWSY